MATEKPGRANRFDAIVQKSRALVYTTAVALGIVGKLLGVIDIGWGWLVVFLGVADASAALFFFLARRGIGRLAGVPVRFLWMAADVLIVSWAVLLSGGVKSFWFVFYLTNAAAATYVAGVRGMVAVMLANTAAYVGVAALGGEVSGVLLAQLVGRKVLLYGAAFFALLGIPRLERRRQEVRELQRQALARARELEELAGKLEQANHALHELSMHDALTRLPNRRFVEEHARRDVSLVRRSLDAARRYRRAVDANSSLGFFMVDLDHFKAVNDSWGHEIGDRLLVETGRTLQRALRDADSVVRWGGEEFLVMARKINRAFMWTVAERLRLAVEAQRLKTRTEEYITITCSVGYCCYPLGAPELFSWKEVVHLADAALLLAKRAGRNRSVGLEVGLRELELGDRERVLRNPAWAVRAGFLTLIGEVDLALLDGEFASSGARPPVSAAQ